MTKPCKCGCTLFYETNTASGKWVVLFDMDDPDESLDTCTDGVRLKRPKTVTCAGCGRRAKNPRDSLTGAV